MRIHRKPREESIARDKIDQEREQKLEQAEAELEDLKQRAARIIPLLRTRAQRNHWRESIERMIWGGI